MKNLLLSTSSLLISGNILLAQDSGYSKKFVERYQQAKEEKFIDIHNHIINIRKWLWKVDKHCSSNNIQGYLNEFNFR